MGQVYVRQVWKQQLATTAIDGTRSARRLDDSTFGLSSLFELHDRSMLPELMAEACTKGGQPDSPQKEEEDMEEEAGADSDDAADPQRNATQELEMLHGMFDQVNHAKVLRSDTQEN